MVGDEEGEPAPFDVGPDDEDEPLSPKADSRNELRRLCKGTVPDEVSSVISEDTSLVWVTTDSLLAAIGGAEVAKGGGLGKATCGSLLVNQLADGSVSLSRVAVGAVAGRGAVA